MNTKFGGPKAPPPCIWVTAGVLVSGWCDRDFDCDRCDLHKALSRQHAKPSRGRLAWPVDRTYMRNHLWLTCAGEGEVKVGLTPFGAELLHPVKAWDVAPTPGHVQGEPAAVSAVTLCGTVKVALPAEAELVHSNPRLAIDPLWPAADPWESGYLIVVKFPQEFELASFSCTLADMEGRVLKARRKLTELAEHAGHFDTQGVAAADGGVPAAGWGAVLGRETYRRFLLESFNPLPD